MHMQKKNLFTSLALVFFFGPFGVLYTSTLGFWLFAGLDLVVIFFTSFIKFSLGDVRVMRLLIGFGINLLPLYWTFKVVTERNRRIEQNIPLLTPSEELSYGFNDIIVGFMTLL